MKITEEMIARAAAEADKTILDMYPDRYEEEHVFSEEFCRKMHEIDPDIDPVTGGDTQRGFGRPPSLRASYGRISKEPDDLFSRRSCKDAEGGKIDD